MKKYVPKWEPLTKNSMESLVYLVFFKPRMQIEGVRLIYGKPKPNIQPIIRARKYLYNAGYIEISNDPQDLRNIVLKSKPEPFINYVIDKLKKRSVSAKRKLEKYYLTEDEKRILFLILDSNWFRNTFFSKSYILSHYNREFNKDKNGKLFVTSAFVYLAYTIERICVLSYIFKSFFKDLVPNNDDIISFNSFDTFIKYWARLKFNKKLRSFLDKILPEAELRLGYSINPFSRKLPPKKIRKELLYEKVLRHDNVALCFPFELSKKLMSIGRVPMTEHIVFSQILEEYSKNYNI